MELPFAVDASPPKRDNTNNASSESLSSSLVTASSQGSLIPAEDANQHHNVHYQNNHKTNTTTNSPLTTTSSTTQAQALNETAQTTNAAYGMPSVSALKQAGSRVTSALFGSTTYTRQMPTSSTDNNNNPNKAPKDEQEVIDFAYINYTDEDEVDVWLDDGNHALQQIQNDNETTHRGDVLEILLSSSPEGGPEHPTFWTTIDAANAEVALAGMSKNNHAQLPEALQHHTAAAKLFHEAAAVVQERDASMAKTLLLLSQSQAKSALALKKIVQLQPNALTTLPNNSRLRATVRGALNSSKPETDMSDSTFLGSATKAPRVQQATPATTSQSVSHASHDAAVKTSMKNTKDDGKCSPARQNPVDEMMELERELRDMDMRLELGNSIASLDARTQSRLKSSVSESSFLVVPAGSYMSNSSSVILGPAALANAGGRNHHPSPHSGSAGVRARANRVQSSLATKQQLTPPQATAATVKQNLEESGWWGSSSSSTSQVLTSSVMSLVASQNPQGRQQQQHQQQHANTKQLMRLMDSLRTLGDENAALLSEVEDAEAARMEARAAREQMKRFKDLYGKRFAALKEALETFRKGYPKDNAASGDLNPVTTSEFARSTSTSDQLQRQEQLIRKLTSDLKKEKDESKKKDGALRKYESFYREVKARSAQKAAQRQQKTRVPPRSAGSK